MEKGKTSRLIPKFMFSHFSHHVATGVLIPLLPLLRESFGLNYFQSGILVSSFSLAYGMGQVPMAILADRFSKRLIIILGLIGVSLSGICVSFTQGFWQMPPFFVLMGLLGGTYHAPASAFISQNISIDQRGRALGMHVTGGSASFLLTPAMALGIASMFESWRPAFLLLALPALLAGGVIWLTTSEPAEDPLIPDKGTGKRLAEEKAQEAELTWVGIARAIGILVCLTITMNVVFASINSYLPLFMVDHHGISAEWAGIVVSLIAGAGIIGSPVGGALSDRLGRKELILFSLTLSGPLFFAVTRSPLWVPLILSLFFYGLTMSARMPTTESLIADVVPVRRRTTVLGIYFFMTMETSGVITPIVGRLIDSYGLDPVFTGIAIGLCVVAGVALLFRRHI
ncbi:MAG: MFS transporter [Deltaproteobacteria bacterium]|nr:MFS transporter [Deltaproteobacteria bacterium]